MLAGCGPHAAGDALCQPPLAVAEPVHCPVGCVENLKNAKLIIAESGFHWYIYTEKENIFFFHFQGGLAWGVAKSKLPLFVIFSEIIAIFDNLLLLMYIIQMIQIAKIIRSHHVATTSLNIFYECHFIPPSFLR